MRNIFFSALSLVLSLGSPLRARGQGAEPHIELENPIGASSFEELLRTALNYLTGIAAPLLVVFVIWGAFKILTAGDNEANVEKGKKIIRNAVIGFAIILIGWGFVYVIEEFLGVSSGV